MAMRFSTAELCDRFAEREALQIAEPLFRHFGGRPDFCGAIQTLKVFEDSTPARAMLAQDGSGKVLVIDGGGSKRCALLNAELVELAATNGWQGILVYGCLRGSHAIAGLPIGVMALNSHPLGSRKHDPGERGGLITFAGVNFKQDHYLYADGDGIIVVESKLD